MRMIKLTNLLSNAIFQEAKPKKAQINELTGKIKPGLINFMMSQVTSHEVVAKYLDHHSSRD